MDGTHDQPKRLPRPGAAAPPGAAASPDAAASPAVNGPDADRPDGGRVVEDRSAARGSWAGRSWVAWLWAGRSWGERLSGPYGPVVVGAFLMTGALVESTAHAVSPALALTTDRPLFLIVYGLLALATTLPVVALRGQPVAAGLAVSAAGVLSLTAFQTMTVAGAVAQLLTGYRLGRAAPRLVAVAPAVPFPLLALMGQAQGEARLLTLVLASLAPAAALAGIARRARGEARESAAARQVATEGLLEHVARGERARIARDLHDVVAHHISMVAVQAETARLATPGMPPAGAERLTAIGDTARAALTEMRRLLGVLREDAGAAPGVRSPQPGLGLGELNELLDAARDASGTGTRLILRGRPVRLDPGVELTAYRIVQEALTNARRHAPGAAVDVELHYTGEVLRVRVRDNGPGPAHHPPPPNVGHGAPTGQGPSGHGPGGHGPARHGPAGHGLAGHGLAGMRERAAAVGGRLTTGPAPGGGFLIEATLPGAAPDPGEPRGGVGRRAGTGAGVVVGNWGAGG
ncbi:sensor histidine kinase [Nonomuraea sp. 3-1Str]|uniref:sensor histidine kinase n=1 Tax=Nonomuraea sp. 3-1Str TaxID=2929801 RepID=UPI00285620B3|nr:sensor histidine kinase [Nonomuraea sp. 3-1Str]MDR8414034.1 sensor histidine kinase [Nonomuraea sp. 3-1Str]